MFNIGTGEIALIALAALILLGPKGLPELARGIGKFMREFRRQTDEVRTVVEREFYRMDEEISVKGSPEVPEVVAANSVSRKSLQTEPPPAEANEAVAAPVAAPEGSPPPAPELGPSQLTGGMPTLSAGSEPNDPDKGKAPS